MIVIVIVIMVMAMASVLGAGALFGPSVFGGIAAHPDRNTEYQRECDPFRVFHGEFSMFLSLLGLLSLLGRVIKPCTLHTRAKDSCNRVMQSVCILYAKTQVRFVIEVISVAILFGNPDRLESDGRPTRPGGKKGISKRFRGGTFRRLCERRLFPELRNCEPAFRLGLHRHR